MFLLIAIHKCPRGTGGTLGLSSSSNCDSPVLPKSISWVHLISCCVPCQLCPSDRCSGAFRAGSVLFHRAPNSLSLWKQGTEHCRQKAEQKNSHQSSTSSKIQQSGILESFLAPPEKSFGRIVKKSTGKTCGSSTHACLCFNPHTYIHIYMYI